MSNRKIIKEDTHILTHFNNLNHLHRYGRSNSSARKTFEKRKVCIGTLIASIDATRLIARAAAVAVDDEVDDRVD